MSISNDLRQWNGPTAAGGNPAKGRPVEPLSSPKFHALLDWWLSERAYRRVPLRSTLRLDDISLVAPWMFIAEIISAESDREYRYRLSGSRLDEEFGMCITGWRLSELPLPVDACSAVESEYGEAVDASRPVYSCHAFKVDHIRDIAYRRVVVPASSNGEQADLLIGIFDFDHSWSIARG